MYYIVLKCQTTSIKYFESSYQMNILSKIDVTDGDQSVGRYICNPANVKNFGLRSHFSNPLDIDIFNRGDIEIFGQYIIQEKLRRKLYKSIILNCYNGLSFHISETFLI